MIYRELIANEMQPALALAWRVFLKFEAPEYDEKGIIEFERSLHDPHYLNMLRCYGAFDGENVIGVIATRNNGNHIALFFVDEEYQGRGIGKRLFELVVQNCDSGKLTVFSSPFAIPIYHKLGFNDTGDEQVVNGLRFTPMEFIFCRREV